MVVPKVKSIPESGFGRATCAVAKSKHIINIEEVGKEQGVLFLVGIGPGNKEMRIFEAEKMLKKSTDWVGYGLYLDLIDDLKIGQALHRFKLGQEEKRVRYAIELAVQGKTVALISSGDPNIYAMGSLLFELLEKGPDNFKKIHIEISPGISALQAASAKVGAFIGHDFCTISLSDLLTSWEQIESRIISAARGDFVIAFYNPVSMNRNTQLARAREILLRYRNAHTPIILARNLGRKGEQIKVFSLEQLDPNKVDMLTIVLVGSSQTRKFKLPNGDIKVFTPRGYY